VLEGSDLKREEEAEDLLALGVLEHGLAQVWGLGCGGLRIGNFNVGRRWGSGV